MMDKSKSYCFLMICKSHCFLMIYNKSYILKYIFFTYVIILIETHIEDLHKNMTLKKVFKEWEIWL